MDMTVDDVLACLDEFHPDWRSHGFQGKFDEFAMDAIAFNFLKANPSWLDDVVPSIVNHQLEWVLQVFDPLASDELRDFTKNAIFDYIKKGAWVFYLEKEAEGVAYA